MQKKAAQLRGEMTFDLGLGTSVVTGNLEEVLVESGRRVAADGAAVPLILALSLSRCRGWTYLEMQRPWLRHHRV